MVGSTMMIGLRMPSPRGAARTASMARAAARTWAAEVK